MKLIDQTAINLEIEDMLWNKVSTDKKHYGIWELFWAPIARITQELKVVDILSKTHNELTRSIYQPRQSSPGDEK